jgi:pre-rRNA-processing protein TSR1
VEYSRVFEFEAFASTARAYRQQYWDDCSEIEDGGLTSMYCAVYLRGVPPSVMESQTAGVPFVLSNLFPCEQKVSVMHGTVSRVRETAGEDSSVIKSKQEVALACGFRRFIVKPTFSEIPRRSSTCKKYKFMRFLQPEATACASFYAPVVLPPCRLMMFGRGDSAQEFLGSGSISGADPKQLIIKRAVLTGYPFRTHKAKGAIRFMFFNPTDVRWFKPVELVTKKGLRGHISESLGTHGYMKCRFSGHIKQDDTVCMNLYKRAYPKWYPPAWGGKAEDTPENAE